MYFDREMLKLILKNLKYNSIEIDEFIQNHVENLWDITTMRIFEDYEKTHTDAEMDALNDLMKRIVDLGKLEDQQKLIDLMRDQLISSPELADAILATQDELHAGMVMDFLEKANDEGKMELMTYFLKKAKTLKKESDAIKIAEKKIKQQKKESELLKKIEDEKPKKD